ncbi:MAG: ribosomal L7Ae/L30e/S12e/Gadd45 family protein [Bacilli bacterium]
MEKLDTPTLCNWLQIYGKLIGLRQVIKALDRKTTIIRCVVVASDAEQQIINKIKTHVEKAGCEIFQVTSKKELGVLVGIKVNCAVLGLIEELSNSGC